ncbi:MAG: DUF2169 domain-containing protein [Burkholderiales bacterium]|nr:DUF2169 domain-containing protein [Burkholderiales bacterium]MDE1926070.1 DUF2169 domain-containing protein [Burkholderiales bacterium]MDE2158395.1 DUF2169 domain-containing protein [Burkholderiales bacterium]MDE2502803.1 DUF2169 domain-containing protein [Burkholderiales bacterium]
MWQVDNRTPFAAERGWVRDRDGTEIWLVAVKATFDILPDGATAVAAEQPPVLRLPEHHGEPGRSSIKYDADLVLTKRTSDIVVVGHAHAPPGKPVTQLDVGFKVGSVQKLLRVFGDRRWKSIGMSAPEYFTKMPLVWERAYGGSDPKAEQPERHWDWRNPVGTGYASTSRNATGMALPNIEDPQRLIVAWNDRPAPAGFGVVASHWQPRVGFAGTYDDHWMKTRQPLLAEDLDDRHFQSAPQDQQAPAFLQGGEVATLLNLSPLGRLQFQLPRLHLGFETRYDDGSRELHRERRLHSVIIEPDFPRVSLVWHTALPCHFKVHKLERTVVTLKTAVNAVPPQADDRALELD